MITNLTQEDLINFENDVAETFNKGLIKAPVHLYSNNEQQLISIFKNIKKEDWVCCTWRSHYQCLLKGVPQDQVKEEILKGHSISLCFPEYKVISSAIVGGIIPIALGLAKASKGEHVWCFIGDMTAQTGTFHECHHYVCAWNLPITFIIEDNNKSVCTDTRKVWNNDIDFLENENDDYYNIPKETYYKVIYYKYENRYPHAGAGQRVQF